MDEIKKPRTRRKPLAYDKDTFKEVFATSAQMKSLKALETLHKIATTGRAEMARVAAARALIDKAAPQEQQITIKDEASYADVLRSIRARLQQAPLVVEQTPNPSLPVHVIAQITKSDADEE